MYYISLKCLTVHSHHVLLQLPRFLLLPSRPALTIIVDKQYFSVSVLLEPIRCSPANVSPVDFFGGRRELSCCAGRVTLPLLLARSAVPKAATEEARPFAPCPQVVSRVLINRITHSVASLFTLYFSDRLSSFPDRTCLVARFPSLRTFSEMFH